MKRRVLALALAILAFFIFVGSPFQQSAAAVAIVDDAVIAIVIAALAAMGISFSMTGGYTTVHNWIAGQIQQSGIDFSGINYASNSLGQLLINNRFVRKITALARYLQATYALSNNTTVGVIRPSVNLGSLTAYALPVMYSVRPTYGGYIEVTSSYGAVYCVFELGPDGSRARATLWSRAPFTAVTYLHYVGGMDDGFVQTINQNSQHDSTGWESIKSNFYGNISEIPGNAYTQQTINDVLSVINSGQEAADSLDLVIEILDIPTDEEIEGNGGIISLPIPWGGTLPGTIITIPELTIEGELIGNTELDLAPEDEVEGQVSEEATNAQVVSQNASEYAVSGLASVFPFCIPFDLYDFVSCLAADPVAPSFTWRFYVPGICDETIEIDFSDFDQAAQLLRTMELLLFCVGLAFVTRKIIRG